MSFLQFLILQVLHKCRGERSLNGVIHLLKGKRSAQTIQDIMLFNLQAYAAMLKQWKPSELDNIVTELKVKGWINEAEKITLLTEEGMKEMEYGALRYEMPAQFNGLKYEWDNTADYVWQSISLLVQSISYLKLNQSMFIPISYHHSAQATVRNILLKHGNISTMGEQVYNELTDMLQKLPDEKATLFVDRLTSSDKIGKTYEQLASHFHDDPLYTFVQFRGILHTFISQIEEASKYPILSQLVPEKRTSLNLTHTAEITRKLLMSGYTGDEIAKKRNLKKSTIEDHIIEIAIHDEHFDYQSYMTNEQITLIENTARKLQTNRLKLIKDHLNEDVSYFQIRLALSRQRRELHASDT
ncbi:helix-turn-helix domain-containing protein [Salipaludibacillus agaradhaerens]|uniref:Helix-turn-helix domain-containing protein n=1 Tax=Salipaludibacillus agaradhaerens TaxID=76935 RepID=A0A9Q4FX86_SALAG|nr:helix-turn-helix domain-containing protein [Salipaludibacillus agaradhaerens]MCR6096555.1 helix-turn-helix domain-containing protein [Salipaludibacillus agaradhaerens]MCR6113886.1 helix-turn-helix domain-containing protein [Salipaludibacillus agaradhaerens]